MKDIISEEEVISVVVVIEGGMLQTAYSNNKNVSVELIDLDTQDEEELKENNKELKKLEKSKAFIEVY